MISASGCRPKCASHLPSQRVDLLVEGGKHGGDRAGGGGVGAAVITGARPSCSLRSAARMRVVFMSMSRRRARLSAARICARVSFAAEAGSGALASSSSASGASRSSKASSAAGKYSRSRCRSRWTCAGPFPDQRLVGAGHHLDRLGLRAVPRHRPQLVGVGADHVGQGVRVRLVALGAGDAVPLPVAGRLQRVDRVDRVPGRDQRRYPRAAVGLDPDGHLAPASPASSPRCAPISSCSRAIPATPSGSRASASTCARPRPSTRHRDDPQPSHRLRTAHRLSHLQLSIPSAASGRTLSDLMNQCSRHHRGGHDIPSAIPPPGRTGRGTIFHRTRSPGSRSAHPPAATGSRVCRMTDSPVLIRVTHCCFEHAGQNFGSLDRGPRATRLSKCGCDWRTSEVKQ